MEPPNREALHLSLLMVMEAYRLQRDQPLGRQSADAGLLEAYLRYGDNSDHTLVVTAEADTAWFHQQAKLWNSNARTMAESYANTIQQVVSNQELAKRFDLTETQQRAKGFLDHWDGDLQHQVRTSEDRRPHTNARLQGWLSKQGLISKNQEI